MLRDNLAVIPVQQSGEKLHIRGVQPGAGIELRFKQNRFASLLPQSDWQVGYPARRSGIKLPAFFRVGLKAVNAQAILENFPFLVMPPASPDIHNN
jgi:hypothetical protein